MMATTKKTVAKKTVTKKAAIKSQAQEFRMPQEVKEWIDQASSRLAYMTSEILRLKEENQKLKRANKVMETRVMGISLE
jgi:hypothetical protein